MTVSEARAALPELLSRVEEGEEITITRHGRTVAVLVRPDVLRSLLADVALEDAGRIHELLTQAAAEPLPEGLGSPRSEPRSDCCDQGRARRPVVDAFDADVLIYAAVPGHPLGEQVAALFRSVVPPQTAGLGSVLLLPEVLSRPLRGGAVDEVRILAALLARLDLRPVDRATAELATALSSRYRLKAADATHLATAVGMGADRFITNNKRDFPPTITEIQVTYPADLPDPCPRPTVSSTPRQPLAH